MTHRTTQAELNKAADNLARELGVAVDWDQIAPNLYTLKADVHDTGVDFGAWQNIAKASSKRELFDRIQDMAAGARFFRAIVGGKLNGASNHERAALFAQIAEG